MFAVKGWSVSADSLKPEKQQAKKKDGTETKSNKKRKRATHNRDSNVTGDNVVELYESIIEGKSNDKKSNDKKSNEKKGASPQGKQRGRARDGREKRPKGGDHKSADARPDVAANGDKPQPEPSRDEHDAPATQPKGASPTAAQPAPLPVVPPVPPPAAKLTPLQASMRAKLISARFRHLNETLYTRPSAEALRLFTESPEMFSEYHEGFRRQVEVWPENPVDGYIRDIRLRATQQPPPTTKGGKPGKRQGGSAPAAGAEAVPALPHTGRITTIADLGCGDARLAATLLPEARKLRLAIHSFDLHSPSPHVTRADIANVPLADGAVDLAIFCLALMGTNWLDFVEEAYRILRWKGELWVAEIKSRFGTAAQQRRQPAPVGHSVGGRKKKQQPGKKGGGGPSEGGPATDADRQDLAVEVDGAEDRRGETDVSAFVEALRKRGFVLHGEPDMSNRMFVRMLFVKAASPTKGKGVVPADAAKEVKHKKQKRFVWEEQGADDVDEASILKPCVYKLR
ncbi:hypothetical protein ACRALDRAFT_2111754 [Sodiomyces alcalophilus JCM 7366]|uniref:uncharacterized protein n=1 Tax=Sodiomyces alcalophilus JCM 7366 TaxID=591952 RepID=UPI0039B66DCF